MKYAKQFSLADGWSWYEYRLKKIVKLSLKMYFFPLTTKSWKDELLKWNPLDYDGITVMRVPFAIVWTPGRREKTFLGNILKNKKIIFCNPFLDTFLWNAADADSWNQWDTSSRFYFYFFI